MSRKTESVFEKLEAEVVKEAGNYVKDKVRRKVMRIGEISILVIMGFILLSFGLATLIGSYFPMLDNGLNFLILGIALLLIGYLMGL